MKLIALNTANYDDHPGWLDRLGFIVQTIQDLEADVVCLTEIRYTPKNPFNTYAPQYWINQNVPAPPPPASMADQIIALLNAGGDSTWSVFTSPAAQYAAGSWEGLSILSRLPVSGQSEFSIPNGPDANTRLTQCATVLTAGGSQVTIYNTHYALDGPTRIEDSQTIIAAIQKADPGLFAIVGDFNASPGETSLSLLANEGYVDLWAQLQPGQDGFTFPSQEPAQRIDYMWCSQSLANQAKSIATTVEPFVTKSGTVYMSDHLGLVADFDLS